MNRRNFFIKSAVAGLGLPLFFSCGKRKNRKKMVVLGIDGLDPKIVDALMKKGLLPNLSQIAANGTFTMMRSTIPPQSPVAWGSFITGADPGVHGIFDFVHRDPKTYSPKFSLSEHLEPRWVFKLGKLRLPLKPGKMVLQREGVPFWDLLQMNDIGATIFKVPSNFPPSDSRQRTLAGMGTPDLVGGYGIYTLYTSDEIEFQKDLTPHHVYYADINENEMMMEGRIEGPPNSLVKEDENMTIPFTVYLDNPDRTIRIDIQGKEILLGEKEYSQWVPIEFPLLGSLQSLQGMVRFYLLEMGKRFRLYISPIQIDPTSPALPISTPAGFSRQLAERNGLFHTLGLPADFNAIKTGTFSIENFLTQSKSIFDESERLFKSELSRFLNNEEGLLFFYFSSLDQGQHIFGAMDYSEHPFYQADEAKRFGQATTDHYRRCDRILGDVLPHIPPDTAIIVISDHGFAPFFKKVNINNWLLQEGYLRLKRGETIGNLPLTSIADWGQTRSYGLGLNGIYLNQAGREGEGCVTANERRKLLEELKARLEAIIDPQNGIQLISNAFIAEDCFSKDFLGRGPDIVLGFNRNYRSDDRFGEGALSTAMVTPNMNWWSADHCIDPHKVPATFIANFQIKQQVPSIIDLAPTILNYFGIKPHASMTGKSLI